ncbi:Fur family transcriptional regulator [Neobacillus muris]|uniref:Fur family transcriptional regulator n=1 Tax=Neobacillus muris TaxID=2941334 RepID=UPI002041A9D5|nr:Fur family transcriptional regulator [Neobacillus muris]
MLTINKALELIPFLKEQGLRITPQRIQILQNILDAGHPTVEDLSKMMPGISIGTLYNNVKLFVKLGILNELPYGNGISRYEFYQSNHYHVICQSCGDIVDFAFPNLKEVEQIAANLTKFQISSHIMEVYGLCKTCQNDSSR